MVDTRIIGNYGENIALKLWPDLKLSMSGGHEDRNGIDGYLNGCPVQIKYDQTIAVTQNIYHEIYEKSINHPGQEWRYSPAKAEIYIFVTHRYAMKVKVNDLAISEKNLPLRQISETSMGFLVPILTVKNLDIKEY